MIYITISNYTFILKLIRYTFILKRIIRFLNAILLIRKLHIVFFYGEYLPYKKYHAKENHIKYRNKYNYILYLHLYYIIYYNIYNIFEKNRLIKNISIGSINLKIHILII